MGPDSTCSDFGHRYRAGARHHVLANFYVYAVLCGDSSSGICRTGDFHPTARQVPNGNSITAPKALAEFVHMRITGIPVILVVSLIVVAILAALIRFTPLGRRFTAGNDYLLPSIAAVVVGGKGSVVASAIVAEFMNQLGQMVLAIGARTPVHYLLQATVIVLALAGPRLLARLKK